MRTTTLSRPFLLLVVTVALVLSLASCRHEHEYGEWKVDKEATCTDVGSRSHVCECGASESETIPAMGHTSGEWVLDADSSCTANGSKHQICSVCKDTIKTESI